MKRSSISTGWCSARSVCCLSSAWSWPAVVYRDMIAPLRVKLVESQSLVERHEKLASLGMLAAGVAHEIRNPLTAIKAAFSSNKKNSNPAPRSTPTPSSSSGKSRAWSGS